MKKIRRLLFKLIMLAAIAVIGINLYVVQSQEDKIAFSFDSRNKQLSREGKESLKAVEAQCILVLGASVYSDGTPSPMLKDRLDAAISLYKEGVAPKLLLSGDNGQVAYNEVGAIMEYAMKEGVPEEALFLDHAGFSTYESVYRAQYIFNIDSMIVVTQSYHLYRALYGCERMGIKALGAAADQESYRGQLGRDIREVLARDKDFVKWIFKPEPTFLGEVIPISGSGIETH